eukprot:jgi/Hompol1/1140/HPOL_001069-RA
MALLRRAAVAALQRTTTTTVTVAAAAKATGIPTACARMLSSDNTPAAAQNAVATRADKELSSLKFKAYKWMNRIEQLFKAATLVNFLLFLSNGRYRSLIDRLLGMRVVYAHPTMSRSISFDFMNRQLVWQAFTEFVVFLLSYININGLKRSLVKIFKLKLKVDENLATLPPHLCAICFSNNKSGESTLHIPFASDACGHVFCYYCLKTEMMSDELFACPRCGVRVAGIHRIV